MPLLSVSVSSTPAFPDEEDEDCFTFVASVSSVPFSLKAEGAKEEGREEPETVKTRSRVTSSKI